jgi:hypothetical protein
VSLVAGELTTINITNVLNPATEGGYGPFKLATRWYENGQIIDINYAFGSVGIAGQIGTFSEFSVGLSE